MDRDKKWGFLAILFLSMMLVLAGCSTNKTNDISREEEESSQQEESGAQEEEVSDYYVVESKNQKNQTITLRAVTTGQEEVFAYTGKTNIKNKYEEQLTMEQVGVGEIVTITYERDKEKNYRLTLVKLPKEIWSYDKVSNFNYNEKNQTITISEQNYQYGDNLLVVSDDEAIELRDLSDLDVLCVKGSENYIYSVTVTQGHGYISLKNEDTFIGGWIDIGGKVIQLITEKMLVIVPEGTHQMTVSNEGNSGSTFVTIKRDEEVEVDVKNLKASAVESGSVKFKITPKDAILTIKGKKTNYSEVVVLEYGIYPITVKADGYKALSKSLVVQSSHATIELELTKSDTSTEETDTASSSSNNSTTADSSSANPTTNSTSSTNNSTASNSSSSGSNSTSSTNTSANSGTATAEETSDTTYKIYVYGPEDAEIYFDGEYKGIIPVIFEKSTGTHTISIRKSGYTTKSYTIAVTEDNEDVNFVFPSLTKTSD